MNKIKVMNLNSKKMMNKKMIKLMIFSKILIKMNLKEMLIGELAKDSQNYVVQKNFNQDEKELQI